MALLIHSQASSKFPLNASTSPLSGSIFKALSIHLSASSFFPMEESMLPLVDHASAFSGSRYIALFQYLIAGSKSVTSISAP